MKRTKIFLPLLAAGLVLGMGLAACNNTPASSGGDQSSQAPASSVLPKITVTAAEGKKTLIIGETVQLTADVEGVTWESGDAKVATVDATGKVTAVAPGEVSIKAIKEGYKNGSIGITVTRPAPTAVLDFTLADHYSADGWWSTVMDFGGMSFEQGSGVTPVTSDYMDQTNTYLGYFGEGDIETMKFTSDKAVKAELVVTFGSNAEVADLGPLLSVKFNDAAIDLTGKSLPAPEQQYATEFHEVSLGEVDIKSGENVLVLTMHDNAPFIDELTVYAKEQATITLVPSVRESVELEAAELEVIVGKTVQIQAKTEGVSYTSQDETVCTVDAAGVITGVKVGVTTVRVKKDGLFTAVVDVTVRPAEVPGQIVLEAEDYIPEGSEMSAELPQWGAASIYSGTGYITTWPAEAELSIDFNADAAKTMVLSITGAPKMNSSWQYEDLNLAEAFEIKVNDVAVNLAEKILPAPTSMWSLELAEVDLGDVAVKAGANKLTVKALIDGPYVDCFKLTPKA